MRGKEGTGGRRVERIADDSGDEARRAATVEQGRTSGRYVCPG